MIAVQLAGIEAGVIVAGIAAVLVVGPDRRLRKKQRQQELDDIDAWLKKMWEARCSPK